MDPLPPFHRNFGRLVQSETFEICSLCREALRQAEFGLYCMNRIDEKAEQCNGSFTTRRDLRLSSRISKSEIRLLLMIYMPAGWGLHADGKIFLEDSQSVLLRRDGDRTLIGMLFRNRLQRVQFRRCLAQ